jgi:hypothetical protein
MSALARAGLTARGVMYIVIGIIAVQIAIDGTHQQADRAGALRLVAATPFGAAALWLLVAGFAAMTLWRLAEAAWGEALPDGHKATRRLANLARGIFYGVLTFGVLKYAVGLGQPTSSDQQTRDLTATAMHYPGGRVVVAIAGFVIVGCGIYTAYRAIEGTFLRNLQLTGTSPRTRKTVRWLGQTGGVARGAVYCTVGVFLIVAGLKQQPDQAKGLDSALRAFAATPLGPWLLIVVAAGLITYGAYSFCEARWRRT